MYTAAYAEFPRVTKHYELKSWCPRAFQLADKRTWRYYESSKTNMEPMYEALNTPNYTHSIKKKHW